MARLRLHPDSYDALDRWWFSDDASPADRGLVSQLLTDMETGGLPASGFYREANPVNRNWTNVLPREGLVVVVEMFTEDAEYFRVVAVTTLTRNPDASSDAAVGPAHPSMSDSRERSSRTSTVNWAAQRSTLRMTHRGRPPLWDVVGAARSKPACSKSSTVPT